MCMLEFETVKGADSKKDKDIDQYRALPAFYGYGSLLCCECDSQQDVRVDQQRS